MDQLDPHEATTLADDLDTAISKRDLIHQDRLGLRANIDWHAIGHEEAFLPAKRLITAIIAHRGSPSLQTHISRSRSNSSKSHGSLLSRLVIRV